MCPVQQQLLCLGVSSPYPPHPPGQLPSPAHTTTPFLPHLRPGSGWLCSQGLSAAGSVAATGQKLVSPGLSSRQEPPRADRPCRAAVNSGVHGEGTEEW